MSSPSPSPSSSSSSSCARRSHRHRQRRHRCRHRHRTCSGTAATAAAAATDLRRMMQGPDNFWLRKPMDWTIEHRRCSHCHRDCQCCHRQHHQSATSAVSPNNSNNQSLLLSSRWEVLGAPHRGKGTVYYQPRAWLFLAAGGGYAGGCGPPKGPARPPAGGGYAGGCGPPEGPARPPAGRGGGNAGGCGPPEGPGLAVGSGTSSFGNNSSTRVVQSASLTISARLSWFTSHA